MQQTDLFLLCGTCAFQYANTFLCNHFPIWPADYDYLSVLMVALMDCNLWQQPKRISALWHCSAFYALSIRIKLQHINPLVPLTNDEMFASPSKDSLYCTMLGWLMLARTATSLRDSCLSLVDICQNKEQGMSKNKVAPITVWWTSCPIVHVFLLQICQSPWWHIGVHRL